MLHFFDGIQFDNAIFISIIAINLTLIGLTSLAESKKVMGVEYGKFLINEFRVFFVFGFGFKLKYWLFIFIAVNGLSIFALYFTKYAIVAYIMSISLSLCLVTLLGYFFFYILLINKEVKKQIYISSFCSMYTSLNERHKDTRKKRGHGFFDPKMDISDGRPTKKRIVSSVYRYFNDDDFTTQDVFEDIFSYESVIYQPKLKYNKDRINCFIKEYNKKINSMAFEHSSELLITKLEIDNPYEYRNINGIYDISHEFFQMVRYTNLQDKWCLSMYNLSKNKEYNFISYSNIVRITCNMSLYGVSDGVRTFKFIKFLSDEYILNYKSNNLKTYLKRIDNHLDPIKLNTSTDKINLNDIESLFLENYFLLQFSAASHAIDKKIYKVLDELNRLSYEMIVEKTFLSKKVKIEIFKDKFYSVISIDKNLDKKFLNEEITKLCSI